jgi:tRNA modification GTPase
MTGSVRRPLDTSETIFALITGPLPTAVGVVRVSGPQAFSIAKKIFKPHQGSDFRRERAMTLGALEDGEGKKIDEGLALSFVAPHSFSGDDTIEFQCHGSIPVIHRLERVLEGLGARPAERGEFSYRALIAGKLNPERIEELGDLYLAREPADLAAIYRRKEAGLQTQIQALRGNLVRLQAILDTAVDFSDEYARVTHQAEAPLTQVIQGCSSIIQRYESFRAGRATPRLVLAGRPNAGKSSLFNALLCRYRAIVHEEPGTTRDVIEEDIEWEGRRWKLVDTAGVREVGAGAELQGMELGDDYLSVSQFWILVVDGTVGIGAAELSLLDRHGKVPHLIVWNKQDLPHWHPPSHGFSSGRTVALSVTTEDNLSRLLEGLREELAKVTFREDGALPTAVQTARLRSVRDCLEELRRELAGEVPPEFLAERNRQVIQQLEEVIGEVDAEEVLDRIFHDFCIGK